MQGCSALFMLQDSSFQGKLLQVCVEARCSRCENSEPEGGCASGFLSTRLHEVSVLARTDEHLRIWNLKSSASGSRVSGLKIRDTESSKARPVRVRGFGVGLLERRDSRMPPKPFN